MNTIRSVGYGWGVLIAAGGGAYYFAKKSINADREERHNKEMERRAIQAQMQESAYRKQYNKSSLPSKAGAKDDMTHEPSQEASADPAPTRHAPDTEAQRVAEKSKYEASEVWRSKKGDRLS